MMWFKRLIHKWVRDASEESNKVLMGAAVATVLGQGLTAVLAIWYLCNMKAIKLKKNSFALSGKVIGRFIPLGICSFLAQISLVAAMAASRSIATCRRCGICSAGERRVAASSQYRTACSI